MTDREAIEAAVANFIESYNAGDLAGVMRCYSDDLIKTRNGAPAENRQQTESRLAEVIRAFSGALHVVNEELVVSGDMAFARGSLRLVLTPRGPGEARHIALRFLEIWRRENGRWVVARTMDNTA